MRALLFREEFWALWEYKGMAGTNNIKGGGGLQKQHMYTYIQKGRRFLNDSVHLYRR